MSMSTSLLQAFRLQDDAIIRYLPLPNPVRSCQCDTIDKEQRQIAVWTAQYL